MKDLFRKGMLVGFGIAEVTKESLAKAIAELEKKGEVSKGQARKIMDSFTKTAGKRRKEMESTFEKAAANVLGKMNIATESRIKEVEDRLRKVERKLRAAKNK